MTKARRELFNLCKTIDADHEYILDCLYLARFGSELDVMGKLYEVDEIIGGQQCIQENR